jgi:hypothetical protein
MREFARLSRERERILNHLVAVSPRMVFALDWMVSFMETAESAKVGSSTAIFYYGFRRLLTYSMYVERRRTVVVKALTVLL